jgi:SAM-dependent methyltransferase
MQVGIYEDFGRFYDLIYRDKDYAAESEFVYSLIRKYTPDARSVLELGCGTGIHAQYLAEYGLEVIGIDQSLQMLEKAEARKKAATPAIAAKQAYSLGEASRIRLGRTFDAVIALFHLMSYQVSHEDMAATFQTATEHLRPGGVFIFDYWYGPAVLREWPSVRVKRVEDESVSLVRVVEPVVHANENVVDVNYQFFVQDKQSGGIETFREFHHMRYLFLPELELILAQAGLTLGEHGEWMTGSPPGFNTWSAYSIERK